METSIVWCLKRLKPAHIQQITEALGLPTVSSTTEARRAIEEKLTEMEYEPESVQVIIQGRGDDASMYLVNDTGIIKTIECVKVVYRTNDETSSKSADSCSALQDTRHVEPVVEVESRPGDELVMKLIDLIQAGLELLIIIMIYVCMCII